MDKNSLTKYTHMDEAKDEVFVKDDKFYSPSADGPVLYNKHKR